MVDIMSLVTHLLGMNDEQIGAWIRKAVNDCLEGCIREDVDKLVKECYERSLEAMKKKQEFDAQTYRRRLERQGKSANLLATTLCHTVSTEKASKEGGDTREDSLNLPDSDAPKGVGTAGGSLESGTPSLLPFTVTTTRNQLAGEITPESQDKTSLPVSLAGNAPASTSGVKKPYGTCGHVMLTDEEGHHLRDLYGENLRIAIDILDAYIENNGKAAKRYKNHAAVMRKGNWVWRNVQEMKRLENSANRSGKSFKQQDRDHQSELLHTSLFAPSIGNKRIANG